MPRVMRRERETLSGSDGHRLSEAGARKKMIRWIVSRGGFDWIIDGNEGRRAAFFFIARRKNFAPLSAALLERLD